MSKQMTTSPKTPPRRTPTTKTPSAKGASKVASTPARATSAAASTYRARRHTRQTATFEGKRDNKPILLKWGRNLSSASKTRLQRRLYLWFAGIVVGIIALVALYGWLDFNFIQPNQPIVTVNSTQIPQRMFRYMVAYKAQDVWNQLQAATKQNNDLTAAGAKDPAIQQQNQTLISQLTTTITSLQTSFTQTQVDQDSIDQLTEDVLIKQAIPGFQKADPKNTGALSITTKQINDAYAAFAKAFPSAQSIGTFLSKNNMSQDDLKSAIAVKLRRDAMDKYLQSTYVSPIKQVDYRIIHLDLLNKAKNDLQAIHKDPNSWNTIAARDSLDTDTRANNGGDVGWVIQGQKDQGIERWAFASNRKVGDISDVIKDVSGTYDIVQILNIDPARPAAADTLSGLQQNALSHWLTGLRNLPPTSISPTNQDMFNSPYNVPQTPVFVNFPSQKAGSGVPGGGVPTGP